MEHPDLEFAYPLGTVGVHRVTLGIFPKECESHLLCWTGPSKGTDLFRCLHLPLSLRRSTQIHLTSDNRPVSATPPFWCKMLGEALLGIFPLSAFSVTETILFLTFQPNMHLASGKMLAKIVWVYSTLLFSQAQSWTRKGKRQMQLLNAKMKVLSWPWVCAPVHVKDRGRKSHPHRSADELNSLN